MEKWFVNVHYQILFGNTNSFSEKIVLTDLTRHTAAKINNFRSR